jgi:glutathione S-transferase
MSHSIMLYSNPRSRGRIARWMLEECGADYDVRILEYGPDLQSDAFRSINPMGKLPTIVHGETVVTECAAICAYLADAFPDAGLAPPASRRGAYYRWLFFAAGPFEAAITNQALGVEISAEQQGFVGYGDLNRVLDTLEKALDGRNHIAGDEFSAADVYLGSQIGFGLQFKTIEPRPAFTEYWTRLAMRDAYKRANELDDKLAGD